MSVKRKSDGVQEISRLEVNEGFKETETLIVKRDLRH
jgi:hypothetical protein